MGDTPRGIYVQIDIRAPLDRIWQLTQTPELHQQWDLRFSKIEYLARPDAEARCTLALVWMYQGIVPKLIFHHADERSMLHAGGLSAPAAQTTLTVIGWCEVAMGLLLILMWRWRWPLWITLTLMPLAAAGVAVTSPSFFAAAFNPILFNATVFALAPIALLSGKDIPSASRCVR